MNKSKEMKQMLLDVIKKFAKNNNLTQKQLAEKIGTSQSRLSTCLKSVDSSVTIDCLVDWVDKIQELSVSFHVAAKQKAFIGAVTKLTHDKVEDITTVEIDVKSNIAVFMLHGDGDLHGIKTMNVGDKVVVFNDSLNGFYEFCKAESYFPESRIHGTVGVDTPDQLKIDDDVTNEVYKYQLV